MITNKEKQMIIRELTGIELFDRDTQYKTKLAIWDYFREQTELRPHEIGNLIKETMNEAIDTK